MDRVPFYEILFRSKKVQTKPARNLWARTRLGGRNFLNSKQKLPPLNQNTTEKDEFGERGRERSEGAFGFDQA